jgi:DNA-binding transcriptional MocR family regulator
MAIWRPRIQRGSGPIYLAIADAIERALQDGTLEEGARLPTHRALAEELSVTAVTVTRAYGEAARRGLIESTVGRGTYARATGVAAQNEPRTLDLTRNVICGNEELSLPREFQAQLRSILRDPEYQQPASGSLRHRRAGAAWISRFGPTVGAEQILVVPGAQPALLMTIAALVRPGERLMTESMTYPGLRSVLSLLGMTPEEVAIDEQGLAPESFEKACQTTGSKVLYTVPNYQNPTAVVMPERRRTALAAIARRRGVVVIEDDVYGFLSPRPLPSIASLLPEQTCYIVSVSKSLSPSLRLGFVAAPAALISRLESSLSASVAFTSTAAAEIFTLLVESGEVDRITRRKQDVVARNHAIVRRVFGDRVGATERGSPHVWLTLPREADAQVVASESAARGVAVAPGSAFVFDRMNAPNALRLSIGATTNAAALEQALMTVAGIASGSFIPAGSVV